MPCVSLTMKNPRQGRSLDNTRRSLLADSVSKPVFSEGKKGSLLTLMSQLPPMPKEQEKREKKANDKLSRAPSLSKPTYFVQQEAPRMVCPLLAPLSEESETGKPGKLLGSVSKAPVKTIPIRQQSKTLTTKRNVDVSKQLDAKTRIFYSKFFQFCEQQDLEIAFEKGIAKDDVQGTINLLYNDQLRRNYPLARGLYAVMMNQKSTLHISSADAAVMSFSSICRMARSVATFGQNEQFLANYDKLLRRALESKIHK